MELPLLGKTSERNRIIISLGISMIILIGLGIYANTYTFRYRQSMSNIATKGQIIAKANQVMSEIQELQSTFRGYLITKDPSYLASFNVAERMVRIKMIHLKSYPLSNTQKKKFEEIDDLIQKELAIAKSAMDAVLDTTRGDAKSILTEGNERQIVANLKYKISAFISQEKQEQNASFLAEKKNSNFDKVIFIVTLSIIVSVAILLLSLLYILKTYKRLTSTEKLLLQSQLRLENILDMLPIGIIIVNAFNKEYHANHKALELLDNKLNTDGYLFGARGVTKENEAGFLTPEIMDALLISKALVGEHHIGINHLMVKNDNLELPLRVSATPLYNEKNQIEYAISVFDDITSIKNVENELIEAKKLVEQSLRLKESFLTNMSHEIRTPMNAILGFTELLARKDLGPQQNEYVRTIQSSSDSLLRLLNDILDFSKLEADMLVFEEQPICVKEIVSSICDLLMPKAASKGITLSYLCDPTVPKQVLGDAVRLNQVLTNIIGNAIKFTDRGSVTILVKLLKTESETDHIEFKIKDTGIGIAPDKLDAIFNRFEQADTETSRFYGGTGLGLSIAKHLIESQGGNIYVESAVNVGTTFSFVIPFKQTDFDHLDLSEKNGEELDFEFVTRLRILLVEDNLFNRSLMEGIFREYGVVVDMVENGKRAIERLRNNVYDVILMDIEMPELNGYAATRTIRNELGLTVPIIALTGHAMAGEREKCLQAGMNDYLTKPVKVNLLFEKMHNVLKMRAPVFIKSDTWVKEDAEEPKAKKGGSWQMWKNDLSYLKEISSGNKEFEKEMIELLLTQIPEQVAALVKAVSINDYAEIRSFAHKLKALVPIAGVPKMAEFFNQLEEQASRSHVNSNIIDGFDDQMNLLNDAVEELRERLEQEYAVV